VHHRTIQINHQPDAGRPDHKHSMIVTTIWR